MKVWDALETTDPKFTKDFNRGFKGTAINPTYGMKKLTEVFGACGDGWGDEIMESRFDEGAWLSERDKEIIHTIILRLWYMLDGIKHEVIGAGTTTFIGKNKNGIYTDEEYFKKSMTDAFTNAAKKLGLSADIFMGMYDDHKYLNEIKNKFTPSVVPKRAEINKLLTACKTHDDWVKVATAFQDEWTIEMFDNLSGHPTKKDETWSQLFSTHKNRVTGTPPVDTTDPKETDEKWHNLIDTADSWASYDFCATMQDKDESLQTDAHFDKLIELEHNLTEKLGPRK